MNNYDSICYKKNFITDVIYKINFETVSTIEANISSNFLDGVNGELSNYEMKNIAGISAKLEQGNSSIQTILRKQHNFFNPDKSKMILIDNESFAVHFKKYNKFEDFCETAQKTFEQVNKNFGPFGFKRFGLRYINKITEVGMPLEWNGLVNKAVADHIENFPVAKDKLSRIMSQVTLNYDDFNIALNFGIYNPEFPSKIARKEFIIDIDASTTICEGFEPIAAMRTYHAAIQEIFETMIDEKLKGIMEPI